MMKAKDIIVGQEYAVGSEHYPERAVALEVGPISRKVYSGARWDFGGHTSTTPACRVRTIDRRTGEANGHETVFALTKILRPWSDQLDKDEAEKQRRQQEAEALDTLRAKAAAIGSTLNTLGIPSSVWPKNGRQVEITVRGSNVDALLALLQRVGEEG